jgi:hypothetical protein
MYMSSMAPESSGGGMAAFEEDDTARDPSIAQDYSQASGSVIDASSLSKKHAACDECRGCPFLLTL